MCKNLVQKGNLSSPLVLYNRTAKRANELSDRVGNCIVSSSITNAVADADIIFSCLTDDNAVLETFTEILKHDVKGKLFVSCSTTQPETSDKLASLVEAQDAGLVTMPGKSYCQVEKSCNGNNSSKICPQMSNLLPHEVSEAENVQ